jgi:hypothetical protein
MFPVTVLFIGYTTCVMNEAKGKICMCVYARTRAYTHTHTRKDSGFRDTTVNQKISTVNQIQLT